MARGHTLKQNEGKAMTELTQNHREYLQNQVVLGKMTADEANVKMVLMGRVYLVTNSIPRQVRSALNSAVKRGEIKHMGKDGHKPECYCHPDFVGVARSKRAAHEDRILRGAKGIFVVGQP